MDAQHDLHVVREMRRTSHLPWAEVVGPLPRVRDFGALSLRDRGPALSLARTELSRLVAARRMTVVRRLARTRV